MILTEVRSFTGSIPQPLFRIGDSVNWYFPVATGKGETEGTIIGLHLNIYQDEINWDYSVKVARIKLDGEVIVGMNQDEELVSERELTAHW